MNKDLLKQLKETTPRFSDGFTDETMKRVRGIGNGANVFPLHRYLGMAAAVCLVAMIATSFLTDGGLSADGLLGLGDLDVVDVNSPFFEEDINGLGQ